MDAGWEKISVTFTPDTSGTYSLAFVQDKADGTAYCDDMQLEAHAAASNANLVQNGTFASGAPDFWTANRYTKSSEHPLGAGKGVSMHAEGSSVGGTRTSQVVPINYYAGLATFLLSAGARPTPSAAPRRSRKRTATDTLASSPRSSTPKRTEPRSARLKTST